MQPHNKYKPDTHPKLYTSLMADGKTVYHFLNAVGITKDTFYVWVDKYPELEEAYEQGEALAYNWWLRYGLDNSENKDWDNTVWKHTMNTRFRVFTQGIHLKSFNQIERALDQHKYLMKATADQKVLPKDSKMMSDLIEAGERIKQFSDQEERLAALEKQIAQSQKI